MNIRSKYAAAIVATGLIGAATLAATGSAGADHAGAVTSGSFSGRAEVASGASDQRIVGDPNGRGEAYVFSPGGGLVCYVLEVDKIAPALAAHIHFGEAGTNGGVAVPLTPPTDGTSAGCFDTGDADLAADITVGNPWGYYVNVHNADYPGGAVRAQLGN